MKWYRVEPDGDYPHNYLLDASHKWSLPGVKCSVCGWEGSGPCPEFPTVNLPSNLDPKPYLDAWPVKPEQFRELVENLRLNIKRKIHWRPGTEFGPLEGTASGKFGDITWLEPGTMLFSLETLERLNGFDIGTLTLSEPNIQSRSKKSFNFREIELEPFAELDPGCLDPGSPPPCPECTIWQAKIKDSDWGGEPVIIAKTIPKNIHLTRIQEFEGYILGSEKFVDAALELQLSDLKATEIQLT
jgi:uncharacterized double-CXXCG motif protein